MKNWIKNKLFERKHCNVKLGYGVRLFNKHQLKLGENIRIDDYCLLNAKNGLRIGSGTQIRYGSCVDVWKGDGIDIGNNVFIGFKVVIKGPGKVAIGNDSMIGSGSRLEAVNHNFEDKSKPIRLQGVNTKGIIIEDDVWIGTGAIILDGAKIGKGSIIGAGSLVNKEIPPYSIAVGIPAKVIKQR